MKKSSEVEGEDRAERNDLDRVAEKTSKVHTDITEDVIRGTALALGLVDVKVCAVNEVWSGLKLVIRVKDRK